MHRPPGVLQGIDLLKGMNACQSIKGPFIILMWVLDIAVRTLVCIGFHSTSYGMT